MVASGSETPGSAVPIPVSDKYKYQIIFFLVILMIAYNFLSGYSDDCLCAVYRNCELLILSTLDDVAYLLNLRGECQYRYPISSVGTNNSIDSDTFTVCTGMDLG
jgi:hypothetical protein